MSLRTRIFMIILLVVTAYTLGVFGIYSYVIMPSYKTLENESAHKDIHRCIEALSREIYHLDHFATDWSNWDDSYKFVEDRNAEFMATNLNKKTFDSYKLNLISFVNLKGEVVWSEAREPENLNPIELKEFSKITYPINHPWLIHSDLKIGMAGIIMTEYGPMLLSSRPILTSNEEGPSHGTLLMGRFMTIDLIKTLEEQTQVTMKIWSINDKNVPQEDWTAFAKSYDIGDRCILREVDGNTLMVYDKYKDIDGNPALIVRAEISREVTKNGYATMQFTGLALLVAGGITAVVMLYLLQRYILRPISILTRHAVKIGQNSDLTARLEIARSDEIGALAGEFDKMVEQLAETRKRLLEQSYYSGMAEIASGTLHNIRNALNPIIVQVGTLQQELSEIPIDQIRMAEAEIKTDHISSQRKNDLSGFLAMAHGNLMDMFGQIRDKIDLISKPTATIEEIIRTHDSHSRVEHPIELLRLSELMTDAKMLLPHVITDTILIELDSSVDKIGVIRGPRIALIQVFSNILTNAGESILRTGKTDGHINVMAEYDNHDGASMIHLRFMDNGQGIAAENLRRLFERGYTTKKNASSGIGLHWCANTLNAIKGRIYAESLGLEKGACFHVLIPN